MKVAVAVIFDANNQILITQRPLNKPYGGYWEFPGGKVEEQETPQDALVREIDEEIGIHIISSSYLGLVINEEPTPAVNLLIYRVDKFQGEPICRESQLAMRWVALNKLSDYAFPKANQNILNLIQAHS